MCTSALCHVRLGSFYCFSQGLRSTLIDLLLVEANARGLVETFEGELEILRFTEN